MAAASKILLALVAGFAFAQEPATIPLWPNGAPGALGAEEQDQPTLTVFLPRQSRPGGVGLIVCPGGGYLHQRSARFACSARAQKNKNMESPRIALA